LCGPGIALPARSGPVPGQAREHRGVIRGIHFADVPPGQAKYVACVGGAVLDVIVDLRVSLLSSAGKLFG